MTAKNLDIWARETGNAVPNCMFPAMFARWFLKNNEEAVKVFLSDHKVSAKAAVSDPKTTAEQIVQAGIIEKAPIAQKALPYCNITFIEGEEMKAALSGYLNVLFEQDPKSVGGKLPADNFYYIEK